MAERRMFAKTIIESDSFNELSKDAQILYFHLGMNADDDGFLNNSQKIVAGLGIKKSALDELIEARFLIRFPSGVVVIKHWRINNYIQKDRYKSTMYGEEKELLEVKENGSYTEKDKPCIHKSVYSLDTQVRLGKDSIGKDSIERKAKAFTPPTLEEVKAYCIERKNNVDATKFFEYYSTGGWKDREGKPVKNWKQKVITWERDDAPKRSNGFTNKSSGEYQGESLKEIEKSIFAN